MSDRSHLEEISIRNLGIIESSSIEFGPGLNVLTGETGAGKTMILTALSLVLGGKSESTLVRHGSERLNTSASFVLPKDMSDEQSEYCEDGKLILSRTVNSDGKSKASANGATVAASVLTSLGESLIEIHGQSANQNIVKTVRQRELLDRFGGDSISKSLNSYQEMYSNYQDLKNRLAAMRKNSSLRDSEIASLEEFLNSGNRLKPKMGEYSEIDDEISRLSSVEDLRIASSTALAAIDNEEAGAHALLAAAKRALAIAQGKDESLDSIADAVNDSYQSLNEALHDLNRYLEGLSADPSRLDFLQNRKAELAGFIKKYGDGSEPAISLDLIIEKLKGTRAQIADLRGGDERIHELEAELTQVKKDLVSRAAALTESRKRAAEQLSTEVSHEIHALAMPHTNFYVEISNPDYKGILKESDFTSLGCDEIVMQIQGHKDGPLIALGKGASGGEMSRIMLALEVVIAQTHPVGTYIFDEVDAGVGGSAAIEVGRRLHQLAKSAQVIVVTHLPQVAAWGDTHFAVTKSTDGTVISSSVTALTPEKRIEEIARMLAGLGESSSAREHAAELLALRS